MSTYGSPQLVTRAVQRSTKHASRAPAKFIFEWYAFGVLGGGKAATEGSEGCDTFALCLEV